MEHPDIKLEPDRFVDIMLGCVWIRDRLSLVPGADRERLVHTDALPVN